MAWLTSSLSPFAIAQSSERVQLAAANETGRRGHLSTQTERVTFWGERESKCCCRNRSGLASAKRESEWCRKDKTQTHRRDNNMRLWCEKKGDPGCQSKETHPTSTRLQYEFIDNGLYSPLPIWQRSVTDLSSPLPIGLTFVTGSFNIRYKEFM
jgi:hypothetical protein